MQKSAQFAAKRLTKVGVILGLAGSAGLATPAVTEARGNWSVDVEPIVQEWDVDGTAIEDPPSVGAALLVRRPHSLRGAAYIEGLVPNGVYTFWWVVIQDDGTFPDDIFVARGGGKVANADGAAFSFMRARNGQPGIEGFVPDGVNEIEFASLADTTDSVVRIEAAYHGQADEASGELKTWLSDFWSGAACPPETPNPNPEQPHCPVYYAATFEP